MDLLKMSLTVVVQLYTGYSSDMKHRELFKSEKRKKLIELIRRKLAARRLMKNG